MALFHHIKNWVEALTGLRIYRSTLPHGTDLMSDLKKVGLWPKNPLIFDVGAHLGQTALALVKASPSAEIHCFEPASLNYGKLSQALAGYPSIHLWKMALADLPGQLRLYLKNHSTTHSLVNAKGSTDSEVVRVDTLDAFCECQGIGKIHFCKIDTEGADLAVLQGASAMIQRRQIDFIQVETSTREDVDVFSPFQKVNDYLTGAGYELFGFYEQQPCWTGRQSLLYFNAVYISPGLLADRDPID